MKAGIIRAAGQSPVYGDFTEPIACEGKELITVTASALSQFSKSQSSGSHYARRMFPSVAGADGIGRTRDGAARVLRPAEGALRGACREIPRPLTAARYSSGRP
jgi:hypothetical protein